MTEVTIYVEGASDEEAMGALLKPLIAEKQQTGISISFFKSPPNFNKQSVLEHAPKRAVNILLNKPNAFVAVLPDLYPLDRPVPHKTFADLKKLVMANFEAALQAKKVAASERDQVRDRFKVFCFKYELEVLILAAEDRLKYWLDTDSFKVTWIKPVEDQNNTHPPKEIVKQLFREHGMPYKETLDARLILEKADYHQIAEACPQCFKPFVEFLEGL